MLCKVYFSIFLIQVIFLERKITSSDTKFNEEYYQNIRNATYQLAIAFESILHTKSCPLVLFSNKSVPHETRMILEILLSSNKLSIYLVPNNSSQGFSRKSSPDVLMLTDKPETLEKSVSQTDGYLCLSYCFNFFVILSVPFKNEDQLLKVANKLANTMWKRRIRSVVFAGIIDSYFVFTKATEFIPNKICKIKSQRIVGKSNENLTPLSFDSDIEANNCTMKGSFIPLRPFIEPTNNSDITGVESEILRSISSALKLNFQWTEQMIANFSTIRERLHRYLDVTTDRYIVAGGLPWMPVKDAYFLMPYDVTSVVWLIPKRTKVSLAALLSPLSFEVWLALLTLLFFSTVASTVLLPKERGLFDLVGLLFGLSADQTPERNSHRLFFLSWSLLGFFIPQYYVASLSSSLVSDSYTVIENSRELLQSGLKLFADNQLVFVYEASAQSVEDSPEKTIQSRINFIPRNEKDDMLRGLHAGEIQDSALLIKMFFSHTDLGNDNVYKMKQIVGNYPTALATWRGMPLLDTFDKISERLVETGHIIHYVKSYAKNQFRFLGQKNNYFLELKQLFPAFIVLLSGFFLSSVVLVLEIIHYHCQKFLKNPPIMLDNWKE